MAWESKWLLLLFFFRQEDFGFDDVCYKELAAMFFGSCLVLGGAVGGLQCSKSPYKLWTKLIWTILLHTRCPYFSTEPWNTKMFFFQFVLRLSHLRN